MGGVAYLEVMSKIKEIFLPLTQLYSRFEVYFLTIFLLVLDCFLTLKSVVNSSQCSFSQFGKHNL